MTDETPHPAFSPGDFQQLAWKRPAGQRGRLTKAQEAERDAHNNLLVALTHALEQRDAEIARLGLTNSLNVLGLSGLHQNRQVIAQTVQSQLSVLMPGAEFTPTANSGQALTTLTNEYGEFRLIQKDDERRLTVIPTDETRAALDLPVDGEGLTPGAALMLIGHLELDPQRLPKRAARILRVEPITNTTVSVIGRSVTKFFLSEQGGPFLKDPFGQYPTPSNE